MTNFQNPEIQLSNQLFAFVSAVSSVSDKEQLKLLFTSQFKALININGLMIFTFEPGEQTLRPYLIHFDEGKEAGDHFHNEGKSQILPDADELIAEVLSQEQAQTWTISQLMKMSDRPDYITRYRTNNIKKMAAVPLAAGTKTLGVLFVFSGDGEAFQTQDMMKLEFLVPQISIAVTNSSFRGNLINETREKDCLISLMKNLRTVKTWLELEQVLSNEFCAMGFFGEASLFLPQPGQQRAFPVLLKQPAPTINVRGRSKTGGEFDIDDDFISLIRNLTRVNIFQINELMNLNSVPDYVGVWDNNGMKTMMIAPIFNGDFFLGAIVLVTADSNEVFTGHLNLMNAITAQISIACAEILQFEKITHQLNELNKFKKQLEIEKSYLQEEIQTAHNYSEIVGTSNNMKKVFHLVSQVAATNSSVLILGETGTGKELIARAIHNGSARKDKVMIKVNCATLPANLIESELFGHERGSFTGAMERRIGKFELANNSTIFLDEIGEMPISLQVKLLRALQEKEIERVGGKLSIKTDVRVIAATNRDLFKEVQAGNFRSDLYFRLNVFPIVLPALRERKEDIPLLAAHFAQKYANKLTLSKIQFTSRATKQLIAYNWPGNVRELEHLVERSILVAKGKLINEVYLPGASGDDHNTPLQNKDVKTIDEVEREHIISVLKMVNGKVSGVGGAAEILKIPSTTLSSKIRRLKIKKELAPQQNRQG